MPEEQATGRKVLLLTGPGGSGKTTIAELLAKRHGFGCIDGDDLDSEFFPDGGQWLPENSNRLKLAHEKILAEVIKAFNYGKDDVVLDCIIFGDYHGFMKQLKNEFGNALVVKVLFPTKEEMVKRDRARKCWTTGIERISTVRAELSAIQDVIGEDSYLDTTGQSPDDTLNMIYHPNTWYGRH
jgi:adenylate kinase family enzyme